MLFKPLLAGELSGSLAAITASHNAGGTYFRNRSIPVNPNTSFQSEVRNAVALLAQEWTNGLTQAQRDGWETYAANVPLLNRLGDARNVSGISMYIRSNTPRLQVGLGRVDAAPVTFTLAQLTEPTITTSSATELGVAFTNTDEWATAVGGSLLVYASRPQNPGINFFAGPFRFAGRINGAVVPPTSPALITAPFPFVDGQALFFQVRSTSADGRLSSAVRSRTIAVVA